MGGVETPRGVLASLLTYSLADGSADWLIPLHLDKLPEGRKKWVKGDGLYLFPARKEEWARNREKLRHLNDQGGRQVANILARNTGLHSRGAPTEKAGGLLRKTYLCKGRGV